jgi:hypothetical protein
MRVSMLTRGSFGMEMEVPSERRNLGEKHPRPAKHGMSCGFHHPCAARGVQRSSPSRIPIAFDRTLDKDSFTLSDLLPAILPSSDRLFTLASCVKQTRHSGYVRVRFPHRSDNCRAWESVERQGLLRNAMLLRADSFLAG